MSGNETCIDKVSESKDEVKPEEDNEVSQLSAQQAQNEAAVSIEQ